MAREPDGREPGASAPAWLRAVHQVTGYCWATLLSPRMETAQWERDLWVSPRKRERVLELLQRQAPLEPDVLEQLRRAPTVAGWRALLGGGTEDADASPDRRLREAFDPSQLTEERALAAVLDAVVEKTGYERSQLDPDADLEADLGIASVKQAQILGHLRRTWPVEFHGGLRLKDYPTLRAWAGFVLSSTRGEALKGPARPQPPRGVVREQVEWVAAPLPASPCRPLAATWHVLQAGEPGPPAPFDNAWNVLASGGEPGPVGVLLWVGAVPPGRGLAEALWPALEQLRGMRGGAGLQVLAVGFGARDGAGESPLFAAVSGALKSLAAEDGRVQVAFLRLAPGLLEADVEGCTRAAAEELRRGAGAEAALDAGGTRWVRRARRAELDHSTDEAWHPPSQPRVLVTGGGRGIAARVAAAWAARHRARLLLVGRSAPEAAEVQATLAAVRAAGGEVTYLCEDVCADGAARRVMGHAQQAWGGLDVVLHAAGVIEDARLEDKTADSFARVLAPKVTGTQRLLEAAAALPCFPGAWVGFSSISAQRGNAQQVDYAAANEAMAALLRAGAGGRRARVRVLDFGPWDEVGMAERSGLAQVLREAGEGLVPVADGVEAVFAELAFGEGAEGESTWTPGAGEGGPPPAATFLLDSIHHAGRHLEGRRRLSVKGDLWLAHHSLFDDPVMPGSMGLELMVEAARALLPGWAWVGMEGFTIHGAVTLMGVETLELAVRASASLGGGRGLRTVRCRLELPGGRACYEATVLLARGPEDGPLPPRPPHPGEEVSTSGPREVYARIRLGPAFHLLDGMRVSLAQGRAWARTVPLAPARFFHPGEAVPAFASEPLLLEAGFQAAAWLGLQQASAVVVPRGFRALRVLGALDTARPAEWVVEATGAGRFDLWAWQDGRAVAEVRGYETFDVTALSTWHAAGAGKAGEGG